MLVSCAKNPYEVEDAFYKCLVNKYAEKNIDLDVELQKFEKYLIGEQILESMSGVAYKMLFNKMIEDNESLYVDIERFEKLTKIEPVHLYSNNCLNNLDSSIIKKSKYYELNDAFKKSTDVLGELMADSLRVISNTIISGIDYEHSFYKARVLLGVLYISQIENIISVNLPDKKVKNSICEECAIMIIEVDSLNNISIFKDVFSIEKLDLYATDFVLENAPNYKMKIKGDKNASMSLLFEIISLLKQVIFDIKDNKAIEIFDLSYNELDKDLKGIIDELYPQEIDF
tara:strand:- start:1218 stop:2075 length:858 start_codon:yes stop_codon:yes gene_type:complete